MKYVLNSFEIVSYYCLWVSIVMWLLYKLFEAETGTRKLLYSSLLVYFNGVIVFKQVLNKFMRN